uniref:Uncharacterized protein n=1 Tax=Nelumbo nucifera TaxID=4432 RepID=A0A822Z3H1_NELNU|nr:TPA_asm: hypothetical protein HUJ06_006698 [Nelumbo nucifera]
MWSAHCRRDGQRYQEVSTYHVNITITKLIHNPKLGFQIGVRSSWGPVVQKDGASSRSYLSSVLESAKQRAVGLRWPQLDSREPTGRECDKTLFSADPLVSVVTAGSDLTQPDRETEELSLSNQIVDDQVDEATPVSGSSPSQDLLVELETEKYDEFKADKEAKLKEWLEEVDNVHSCVKPVQEQH